MSSLLEIIREIIRIEGALTIERYMQLVLHHPQYGYYSNRDPLGTEGDFITAPESSQMFGEMLGLWCVDVWYQMGEPEQFVLLELGPGRGTMLRDLLRFTVAAENFQNALRLHLMESNATLREIQKEKLGKFAPIYIEDLAQLPSLPTIFLANEFFDTIPMRQFVKTGSGWRERMVGLKDNELAFVYGDEKSEQCEEIIGRPEKTVSEGWHHEFSPQSLDMVKQLAEHIVRNSGAGLIIDYGYAVPLGEDTLFAVKQHKLPDILVTPGDTDVTAEVDFSAFRQIAEKHGAKIAGFMGQGKFLQSLGIELRAEILKNNATKKQIENINQSLNHLTAASKTGEWFKVLWLKG